MNFTNEFDISDGATLDWSIDRARRRLQVLQGLRRLGNPYGDVPPCDDHGDLQGSHDHLALLLWMNDDESHWAAGVIQISDGLLRFRADGSGRQYNRDRKRRLNKDGIGQHPVALGRASGGTSRRICSSI